MKEVIATPNKHEFVFKTDFNINDIVYPIEEMFRFDIEVCPACEGKKSVTVNSHEFICLNCKGVGEAPLHEGKVRWCLSQNTEYKITSIRFIQKNDNSYETEIFFDSNTITSWDGDNLFFSEEDALKECERRNS